MTEELLQIIALLQKAGVDFAELDNATEEEIASVLEADRDSELDEAQGMVITDDMVWEELEEMIANHYVKI